MTSFKKLNLAAVFETRIMPTIRRKSTNSNALDRRQPVLWNARLTSCIATGLKWKVICWTLVLCSSLLAIRAVTRLIEPKTIMSAFLPCLVVLSNLLSVCWIKAKLSTRHLLHKYKVFRIKSLSTWRKSSSKTWRSANWEKNWSHQRRAWSVPQQKISPSFQQHE